MNWLLPLLALLGGLLLAALLAGLAPAGPWHVELPTWLAARLTPLGDPGAVLERPHALWIAPLALLPFLLLVLRRTLVDLPPLQVFAQLLLRLLLLLALALALAFPALQSPTRGKTVVLAVDVSASVDPAQLAAAEEHLRAALRHLQSEAERGLDRDDRTQLHLVTYGARARALPLPDLDALAADAPLIPRDPEHDLASDHAAALGLAAALIDPEREGRIVLLTDGGGTRSERADLSAALIELQKTRGISVHTRVAPPAARADLFVRGVHLPEELRVGQTFDVLIDLEAVDPSAAADAPPHRLTLRLDQDGRPNPLAPTLELELPAHGARQVKIPSRVTEPGPVLYTATLLTDHLQPQHNRSRDNDRAGVAGEVRGRPRVLLVAPTDPSQALARALRADHLHVDLTEPSALPVAADALRPYDLVIFADVAAARVAPAARAAVATYVQELGGGFIMIGGEGSFGVGGWAGTAVEDLLPVRFEGERQRDQPTLALILVIDKSGSMSSEDRLDLVKEAARATASTLDPSDEIGVIAFDSYPSVLVRLQPAANRLRISGDIRRLTAGGGTNALPALREAYLQLIGSRALIKHVILLSDGQSPEQGVAALLSDMRDADITVSAVGVGAGAGKDFLARVAERGRGRYYFSQDGTDVPRIFSRETREVTRNAVAERLHFPRLVKPVQALRGLDFAGAPGLAGIVPIRPKPLAELLLKTHEGEPLLVRGRRGLGRTVAFASDASPRWAATWLRWAGFPKFWSQIARDTMRQGAGSLGGASLSVAPGGAEGSWSVLVDVDAGDGAFANDLRGELEVLDLQRLPEDPQHRRALPLRLTAPGRYEAELHGVLGGQRLLRARFTDPLAPERLAAEASGQVSVPYPPELAPASLFPDPTWLGQLPDSAEATHSGELAPIFTSPGINHDRHHSRPLWPLVLWALVLPLLALDLLLRRVAFSRRPST
jgi:Ca-activated chloride channel family protein